MGTLGQGSYGKVMLAYLKKRPDEGLYAVKMLRKTETVQYSKEAPTGELDTLQMVANASSVRHINEDGIHGGRFLQRLADHFQDDRFNFIVLVRKLTRSLWTQLIYIPIIGIPSYYIIRTRNSFPLFDSRKSCCALCFNFPAIGWQGLSFVLNLIRRSKYRSAASGGRDIAWIAFSSPEWYSTPGHQTCQRDDI
jgi:hypothetical protein